MPQVELDGQVIGYDIEGRGPPLLLLHGFPQCRAMWTATLPLLAREYTCVTADLRGYGESAFSHDMGDMSFRAMANDQIALMQHLGFDRFHLAGHDRGARTAYRMALDQEAALLSLSLMDIVPTQLLLDDLRHDVARAYYHWFFLAQSGGLPEHFIGLDPDTYFESCLTGWGKAGLSAFNPQALAAYRRHWRNPLTIAAMCADYRAAIEIDLHLDRADLERRITCPALVAYGRDGVMARNYDVAATWADRLDNMQADALPGGHFFPDTHPEDTANCLLRFLRRVGEATTP